MKQPDLFERISAHNLDAADASFPFSHRLARDNGWSLSFARQVIEDYKKFVYLCCISESRLTPSDAVDQAWHLHLTYSYDYWEVFCPDVLGRKLHHGPTKGGEAQDRTFRTAYQATLELYETEFGHAPSRAIWPPEHERFSRHVKLRRVDCARFVLLPKMPVIMGAVTVSALGLTACALSEATGVEPRVLLIFAATAFVFVLIGIIRRLSRHNQNKSDGSGGCSGGGHNSGDNDSSGCSGGCGGD